MMMKNDYIQLSKYKMRIKRGKIKSPDGIRLNLINKQETIELIQNQVVNRKQALEITGQSTDAFGQQIRLGRIKPLITYGEGNGSYSLYYRTDIEEYARTKRQSKVKQRV